MDIEQLKLVLEMVGTATEGAMWFAFAWLAKGAVVELVGWGLFGYFLYQVASLMRKALDDIRADWKATAFMFAMRDIDPDVAYKTGDLTRTESLAIQQTHSRGCEAILAERNADDRPGEGS